MTTPLSLTERNSLGLHQNNPGIMSASLGPQPQYGRNYVFAIYDLDQEQLGEDVNWQAPTTSSGSMSVDQAIGLDHSS